MVYILLDINECEGDPCHVNATCENTIGSLICRCDDMFWGDGFNCEGTKNLFALCLIIIE